jgi:hypothetical protein
LQDASSPFHATEASSYPIPPLPACPSALLPLCHYPDAAAFIAAPLAPARAYGSDWADDALAAYVVQSRLRRSKCDAGDGDNYNIVGDSNKNVVSSRPVRVPSWTLQTTRSQTLAADIAQMQEEAAEPHAPPPLFPLHYDRFSAPDGEHEGAILLIHQPKCPKTKKNSKKTTYDFDRALEDMIREQQLPADADIDSYQSICKPAEVVYCNCDPKLTRVECFLVVAGL